MFRVTFFLLFVSSVMFEFPAIVSAQETIKIDETGVRIQAEGHPLATVLQGIHNATGLHFKYSEEIENLPVTVSINENNWRPALEKLFADFNIIAVWGETLQTSSIVIMNSGNHNEVSSPSVRNTGVPSYMKNARQIAGSMNKLWGLIKKQPGQILPSRIFRDKYLQTFLNENGIFGSKDWTQKEKAKQVHKAARKELQRLRVLLKKAN